MSAALIAGTVSGNLWAAGTEPTQLSVEQLDRVAAGGVTVWMAEASEVSVAGNLDVRMGDPTTSVRHGEAKVVSSELTGLKLGQTESSVVDAQHGAPATAAYQPLEPRTPTAPAL